LLCNIKIFELLHSEIVVSNLWEGERFLVDISSMHLDSNIFKTLILGWFLNLKCLVEMLLIQTYAELIKKLICLISVLLELFLFFLFFNWFLLLLDESLFLSLSHLFSIQFLLFFLLFLFCKLFLLLLFLLFLLCFLCGHFLLFFLFLLI